MFSSFQRILNYIKRVVGIPGDRVEYINKTLFINGIQLSLEKFNDQDSSNTNLSNQMIYIENNGNKEYLILNSTNRGIDFGFNVPDDNYLY